MMELKDNIMNCLKDANGNHVIQKAIEVCPPNTIRFVYETFIGQVLFLSVHAYGCRVIQRCLEYSQPMDRDIIMNELQEGIAGLIGDQYGNYVVQHVVQHGSREEKQKVIDIVSNSFETFSKHKFASNVVEKCLLFGGDDFKKTVLGKMLTASNRQPESMTLTMVRDQYGNYVIRKLSCLMFEDDINYKIEKLLETLDGQDYDIFVEHLQPHTQKAKRTGSAKQVAQVGHPFYFSYDQRLIPCHRLKRKCKKINSYKIINMNIQHNCIKFFF